MIVQKKMRLPTLNTPQIQWIVQQVQTYIGQQHQTYRPGAAPLDLGQKDGMRPFFPEAALDPARLVVLAGKHVNNPPFYSKLIKMGFEAASLPDFALMAAITFADTVVSHQPFTDRLLFHELVHVVQYQKLGLSQFSAQYIKGFLNGGSYEAIPVEMNAYDLEARYAAEGRNLFQLRTRFRGGLPKTGSEGRALEPRVR